ncbi:hypothetical protein PFICI_08678 [Pestalotiopsis fici W106-1]|uniref:Methyltransferase type 11 domain-containing protein n=1 Tax=Pestalotiopsis fici (strain W106-1 / CGMCC3.15140) TaxID=1229662 RepID=W3WYA7_PESFW|nr:uncharacterized protein PFICI_08678 [Pestalotiopsis fici W106-1]ETS78825.1 hypothetical protein PFICI_08678 [Pestalotiopsis fici W106-1]
MATESRFYVYLEPYEPLVDAAAALVATIVQSLRTHGLKAIWHFTEWRDAAFASWYKNSSPNFVQYEDTTAVPALVSDAAGVVLDVGPGNGNQLSRLDKDKIKHVYGIEKNPHFIPDLELQIQKMGLARKYSVIACGIEDTDVLEKNGIAEGSIDTVLCIQVLCSVSDPQRVARGLYKLLKPGGTLIFWEHHVNHDFGMRVAQWFWNPAWKYVVGGCNVNRDTLAILKQAGAWENFDSIQGDEEPNSFLPRIWGGLVKSS